MKKMMNIMMLSSKKATELIEKRWVTKLSAVEKIQLKMYTAFAVNAQLMKIKVRLLKSLWEKSISKKMCQ